MKLAATTWAIIILAIVYAVGLTGFLHPTLNPFFQHLTPINLLFASSVVLAFHRQWSKGFVVDLLGVFLAGYLVELAGINTGVIFGQYRYGAGLGPKIFEVPIIIGLNWALLIYCTGTIASYLTIPNWAKAIVGAVLMVTIDYLIEPFAIANDLWDWTGHTIPVRNYLAWFVVSYLMLLPFFYYRFSTANKIATALYVLQFIFFGVILLAS